MCAQNWGRIVAITSDNAGHSNLVNSTRLVFTESVPTSGFIPID